MMSRGTWPSIASTSSPTRTPARVRRRSGRDSDDARSRHRTRLRRSAPEPAVSLGRDGRRQGAPRRPPGVLRRRGDGHQGAGLDGAGLRAARVLLPRDRPQPARSSTASATSAWCSSTTSPRCRPGRPIMLSAHGSAPEVVAAARASGGYVVDAVCPLVTKVHHEVKVRAGKGYQIVYVGHEGHEEAVGTMAVAPEAIHRVESVAEVDALPDMDQPVALLAQTTLSHRDWAAVADRAAERYPDLWRPGRSDLCFATTNRQSALGRDRRALRRRRRDRLGQLVQHPGARAPRPRVRRGHRGPRQRPRRAAERPPRHRRGHRRRLGARGAGARPSSPGSHPPTASRRCASPTRTSTSRPRGSCATCSRPSTCSPPSASADRCPTAPAARPRPRGQRRPRPADLNRGRRSGHGVVPGVACPP